MTSSSKIHASNGHLGAGTRGAGGIRFGECARQVVAGCIGMCHAFDRMIGKVLNGVADPVDDPRRSCNCANDQRHDDYC